jgi:hypothetical protein
VLLFLHHHHHHHHHHRHAFLMRLQADITFVPAQHWSARGVLDRRNTLWGGWVVKSRSPDLTFYFAGTAVAAAEE